MNVSLKQNDATCGIIKIEIVKSDYAESLDKSLRSFRQKANVPGFRKGMVPMGMVKKLYGKTAMLEEVNKLVSEKLFAYIREEKLNVLGEPLQNQTEQKELDFEKDEDFEFCFDVAFAPAINVELTSEDVIPYYNIQVSEEQVDKQVEAYANNYGEMKEVDTAEEKDMVKGHVFEIENGEPKEGGISVEDAILMPLYLKNEEEKAKFIGAGKNTVITFNPKTAYEGAEAEIAAFLKIEKEAVETLTADFRFEIQEITRHEKAEMNQALFDKVFGEGVITSEEEFRNKIKEAFAEQYAPQCDFKFIDDARKTLLGKVGELELADELLKRWLLLSNEKNTKESLDEEYPKIKQDLAFHLIKDALRKANNIETTKEDLVAFSQRVAKAQFAQYGMMSVPEEYVVNYAQEMLKNPETEQNMMERIIEEKLAAVIKGQVSLDIKDVTDEEFSKML